MKPKTILVTGSLGFIGKHLMEALGRRAEVQPLGYDVENSPEELERALTQAEVIYHLAGVNRPQDPEEFRKGNVEFTRYICSSLRAHNRKPLIVLSSSIQAELENAYGSSKRQAEQILQEWSTEAHAPCVVFRLQNVFGKWCRPNYNSVVATFCHNIAHDLPISISDPNRALELVYIDDVVSAFLQLLEIPWQGYALRHISETFQVTLGELAKTIQGFRQSRRTLTLPSLADPFTRNLYATYLSYLSTPDFAYNLDIKADNRGALAEFMKSPHLGQIFVSRTKPGITRGNHYHHTKVEKFLVLNGDAVVRFRSIQPLPAESKTGVIEYHVSGKDFRVIDIPPGYTHSIENCGAEDLVVLFWASEPFDPAKPDTMALPVLSSTTRNRPEGSTTSNPVTSP